MKGAALRALYARISESAFGRFLRISLGGFNRANGALQAAGLTYFSLLALVPILCLLLLLARTLGADDLARRAINDRLDAMIVEIETGQDSAPAVLTAAQSEEARAKRREQAAGFAAESRAIANALFDRAAAFDAGTLGWIGLGLLMWTVVSTLGMVESAFNAVWRVKEPRPLVHRCWIYLVVALVLPILGSLALSVPVLSAVQRVCEAVFGVTAVTKTVGEAIVAALNSRAFAWTVMFAFSVSSFAFLFKYMPHVKVPFRAAFEGGALTAVLFGGWIRVCAVAQVGIAGASALYGSFAFLPIVLAWLYMSWQIVLLGAHFTYAFQCLHARAASDALAGGTAA